MRLRAISAQEGTEGHRSPWGEGEEPIFYGGALRATDPTSGGESGRWLRGHPNCEWGCAVRWWGSQCADRVIAQRERAPSELITLEWRWDMQIIESEKESKLAIN